MHEFWVCGVVVVGHTTAYHTYVLMCRNLWFASIMVLVTFHSYVGFNSHIHFLRV